MAWVCKCGNGSEPNPPGVIGLTLVGSCSKYQEIISEMSGINHLKGVYPMKKVRVLRVMPFAKIGDQWYVDAEGMIYERDGNCALLYQGVYPDQFIKEGWLEWVNEEKSLSDKFLNAIYDNDVSGHDLGKSSINELAQTAKEHYLGVFDKFVKLFEESDISTNPKVLANKTYLIRKALEQS